MLLQTKKMLYCFKTIHSWYSMTHPCMSRNWIIPAFGLIYLLCVLQNRIFVVICPVCLLFVAKLNHHNIWPNLPVACVTKLNHHSICPSSPAVYVAEQSLLINWPNLLCLVCVLQNRLIIVFGPVACCVFYKMQSSQCKRQQLREHVRVLHCVCIFHLVLFHLNKKQK
jgi:hypothetical protein